jgi:hypothetical protein
MTRQFAAFIALALLAASCGADPSPIQTHSPSSPNPTSYTFPLPLGKVRNGALDAFSIEHQIDVPVFHRSPSAPSYMDTHLALECSTNAVFSEAIFRDPANTNDIYLHTFGTPFVVSPVYYGRDGGLPFVAAFHLHLTATGSNTLVAVTTLDAQVINGETFGFGPCGPGKKAIYQNVAPTTVEEYTVLHYLGSHLGVTNMPDIILPAP